MKKNKRLFIITILISLFQCNDSFAFKRQDVLNSITPFLTRSWTPKLSNLLNTGQIVNIKGVSYTTKGTDEIDDRRDAYMQRYKVGAESKLIWPYEADKIYYGVAYAYGETKKQKRGRFYLMNEVGGRNAASSAGVA